MATEEKKTEKKKTEIVVKPLVPDNFPFMRLVSKGIDCSKGKREAFHLVRKGEGLDVVSDGIIDHHALIQSEKCNAGLENIIRLQTMRYGTIENAILKNKDKQVFADISKIPTSISEQVDYVKDIQSDVDELCGKLGITKDELLKANQEFLASKLADKAKAAVPAAEGDNK